MRLALVGYGKMGHMLERLAPEFGFEVALILDEFNNADGVGLTSENFSKIDAAVEFTAPAIAVGNLLRLAELKVPTVCGTTGWFEASGPPSSRTAVRSCIAQTSPSA